MSIPDMFLTREEKKEKQRRLAETNAAVLAQSVQSEQPAQSIQSVQSVQFVKHEQPEQHPQQLQTRVTPLMFQKPSVRRERLALASGHQLQEADRLAGDSVPSLPSSGTPPHSPATASRLLHPSPAAPRPPTPQLFHGPSALPRRASSSPSLHSPRLRGSAGMLPRGCDCLP